MPLTAPGTEWINAAEDIAAAWPDDILLHVLALYPYPPARNIPKPTWAILVAHVSTRRSEDPVLCAQRLASYVKASGERHGHQPDITQVKESQDA